MRMRIFRPLEVEARTMNVCQLNDFPDASVDSSGGSSTYLVADMVLLNQGLLDPCYTA